MRSLILFSFVFTLQAFVSPLAKANCLTQHLSEAIELNRTRLPLYAARSDGQSRAISQLLIAGERLGLLTAKPLEALERPLRDDGVSILCEDLMPMRLTPEYQAISQPAFTMDFVADTTTSARTEVLAAWKLGGYSALEETADTWLQRLGNDGPYHCMVHHLLSSVARGAALAPGQIVRAEAHSKGPLAKKVIDTFLWEQIELLSLARKIDQLAAPLQAEGLSIICGDVPPISHPELSGPTSHLE